MLSTQAATWGTRTDRRVVACRPVISSAEDVCRAVPRGHAPQAACRQGQIPTQRRHGTSGRGWMRRHVRDMQARGIPTQLTPSVSATNCEGGGLDTSAAASAPSVSPCAHLGLATAPCARGPRRHAAARSADRGPMAASRNSRKLRKLSCATL